MKTLLDNGHSVVSTNGEIPEEEFDLALNFIPRSTDTRDRKEYQNLSCPVFWRCHDSNLHLERDLETVKRYGADKVLVNTRKNVKKFESKGIEAFYFPYAFNTDMAKAASDKVKSDIFFSGKLSSEYSQRRSLANMLSDNFDCDFHTYRAPLITKLKYPPLEGLARNILSDNKLYHVIDSFVGLPEGVDSNPVPKSEYIEKLSESKLAFHCTNKHQQLELRPFEALGSKTCLLHNKSQAADFVFNDMEHLVFYEDASNLKSKVERLLSNGDLRQKIAKAGQSYVLDNHTYQQRLNQLFDIFEGNFKKKDWEFRFSGT
ncbi:MAG: glycosyltransferase [Candidatus Aenigmatarchaeota archaeon]